MYLCVLIGGNEANKMNFYQNHFHEIKLLYAICFLSEMYFLFSFTINWITTRNFIS